MGTASRPNSPQCIDNPLPESGWLNSTTNSFIEVSTSLFPLISGLNDFTLGLLP